MKNQPACFRCRYFKSSSPSGGECHVLPPTPSGPNKGPWPYCAADDWCGRFSEKNVDGAVPGRPRHDEVYTRLAQAIKAHASTPESACGRSELLALVRKSGLQISSPNFYRIVSALEKIGTLVRIGKTFYCKDVSIIQIEE